VPPVKVTATVEKTASPVTFRRAVSRDAEFIRPLCAEAFNRYGPYEKIVIDWLESEEVHTILALKNKRPAGFIMTADANHIKGAAVELMAIAVDAAYRRSRVGERLLEHAENMAIKRGAQVIILHTSHDNEAAQAFFKKHGYIDLGELSRYYPEGQAALKMAKKLDKKRNEHTLS
jgi:ribosomal protein S18 acetylase RimI-like enzyme